MKTTKRILAVCAMLLIVATALLTNKPAVAEDATADNPVLAQVAEKQLLLSDVQDMAYLLYSNGYTETENDYQYALDYLVSQEVTLNHIKKSGMDQFTDEEKAAFANEASQEWESALDEYVTYYLTEDTQEQRDTLRTQAIAYYEAYGYSEEALLEQLLLNEEYDRLDRELTGDYAPSEEEINEIFNLYGEQYRQQYENNVAMYEYYTQYYGYESWYVPEGYRAILHILLNVEDELLNAYIDAQNAYDEADGAETPDEQAIADAKVAMDAAYDAVIASVQPQLDDIYARLEKGESFKSLIVEYGNDPGMEDVNTLATGYPVHRDSIIYDSAFTAGAFQDRMEKAGDYSDPVVGQYGVHVLYYLADMEGGLVMTDDIRAEINDYLLSMKINENYEASLEQWKEGMSITIYQDTLEAMQALSDAELAAQEQAEAAPETAPEADVEPQADATAEPDAQGDSQQ